MFDEFGLCDLPNTSAYVEKHGDKLGHKFPMGTLVATMGATQAIDGNRAVDIVRQHMTGDWGCVCGEDKIANDAALENGNRILSAYPIDPEKPCEGFGDNCIWVITESDRSVTTILLPEEY